MNFGRIVDYKMKFKDKYNLNEREKKRIKEDIKNNCKKRIKEHIKGIIVSILSILLATIAEGFSLITTIVPLLFTIIPVAIHVVCTNINIKWKRENRIFSHSLVVAFCVYPAFIQKGKFPHLAKACRSGLSCGGYDCGDDSHNVYPCKCDGVQRRHQSLR